MTTIRGWLSAAHPFPLAMVLLLTGLIALATTDASPDAQDLALVLAAMLLSQLSIGWSNDYLDRELDAVHQPSKPVPSGLVDPRAMPVAIGAALAGTAILGGLLGPAPFLLLFIGTLCGLVYNLGVKATPFSAAPFIAAFSVLPLYVWTALDVYKSELLALYAIGLTLPVAVHIANVLPDLESDEAQGRRTIAVRLGRTPSVRLLMSCQLAPLLLTALSLLWLEYREALLAASLTVYAVLSIAAGLLYMQRSREQDVRAFRLVVVAGIIFAAGWLAAS